ncbi:hypothetical protein ACNKHX_24865 [Shigella flexneri]
MLYGIPKQTRTDKLSGVYSMISPSSCASDAWL